MAITDGLQYIPSLLFGLIVSFLLAKLFSFVFSTDDQTLRSSATNPNHHKPDVVPSETRRKSAEKVKPSDAEFSRQGISGGENELLIDRDKELAATGSDIDDDWEGVETTELDEAFCAATEFVAAVAADRKLLKVSSGLQLKLYGLYKVATEGACCVPQPSAIKITARAKWNAWLKLGDMSQEEAMQKYLEVITELYPSWADGSTFKKRAGDNNENTIKDTKPVGSSIMHEEGSGSELKLDAIHDSAREGDPDNLLKHNENQMPLAVDHDHIDVAEKLSNRNADTDLKKDNEGETPLHSAAVCEPHAIGTSLVKNNAETGKPDDDGKHPSDLSDSNWHSVQP